MAIILEKIIERLQNLDVKMRKRKHTGWNNRNWEKADVMEKEERR